MKPGLFEKIKEQAPALAVRLRDGPKDISLLGVHVPQDLSWFLPLWKAGARCCGFPSQKWKSFLGLLAHEASATALLEYLEENFEPTDEVSLAQLKDSLDAPTLWACRDGSQKWRFCDLQPGQTPLRVMTPHAVARAIRLAAVESNQSVSTFVVDSLRPILSGQKGISK